MKNWPANPIALSRMLLHHLFDRAAKMIEQPSLVVFSIINRVPLPNLTHVTSALALAISIVKFTLIMATPMAKSLARYALTYAMEVLGCLQNTNGESGSFVSGNSGLNGERGRWEMIILERTFPLLIWKGFFPHRGNVKLASFGIFKITSMDWKRKDLHLNSSLGIIVNIRSCLLTWNNNCNNIKLMIVQ